MYSCRMHIIFRITFLLCFFYAVYSIDCLTMNGLMGNTYEDIDHDICDTFTQGCVQLTVFPTFDTPERRWFGCVEYTNLTYLPVSGDIGDKWFPRTSIIIGNKKYVGQVLICTSKNMCNEEFAVTLEGIYESKPLGYDDNRQIFSGLVIITLFALIISPIYFVSKYVLTLKRRKISEEKEVGCRIEPLPGYDESLHQTQDTADRIVEDGKIATLKELQVIYDNMREKRTKERVRPAPADQEHSEPIRIYMSSKYYKASPELIIRISRTVNARFDNILFAMLCFGPTTLRIRPHNLASLFADFYEILFHEPALIELPSTDEYLIISDLRGEYRDLHRWLHICGYPPTKKLIVLGGMLSNENLFSLETFVFLATLKVSMPYDVYILRGAPESLNFDLGRMESWNISNAITTVVSNICERLPVAACIGSRIFCVHAGISPLINTLNDIRNIDRSRERLDPDKLLSHLLFSEPSPNVDKYEQMNDSRGLFFGVGAIRKFCEDHMLSIIIRGHNPTQHGFFFAAEGRLLSLWSTPGYDGCDNAAVALVHADNTIEIVQMSC